VVTTNLLIKTDEDGISRQQATKSRQILAQGFAPATPQQSGFNTAIIEEAIAAGPTGIRSAQKIALRHAKKMHEETVDYWRKTTDSSRLGPTARTASIAPDVD
jgi:hypothetical protein